MEFGRLNTLSIAEYVVYHMEIDVEKLDRIIYSDGSSLKTVDLDRNNHSTFIGSATTDGYSEAKGRRARFNQITSFFQFRDQGSIYYILVDYNNHCIRRCNRERRVAFEWVGKCQQQGYADGGRDVSRLYRPNAIIKDARNNTFLFVSERGNNCIRRMTLRTGELTTVITNDQFIYQPRGISLDASHNNLITCCEHFLIKHDLINYNYTVLAGSSKGYLDGTLSASKFSFPFAVLSLSSAITLVADAGNNRLRVINDNLNSVTSVCSGDDSSDDGFPMDCSVYGPTSLLVRKNSGVLYVGQYRRIRYLSCE